MMISLSSTTLCKVRIYCLRSCILYCSVGVAPIDEDGSVIAELYNWLAASDCSARAAREESVGSDAIGASGSSLVGRNEC